MFVAPGVGSVGGSANSTNHCISRRLRDDRSIRAAARAERAALIASVGGVDKLDYFWARQDKTRQQRDRESRAANFDRRPRFSGMIFF